MFYNWSDLTASNRITAKFGLLSKTMASAPASTNALTRSLRFSAKTLTAAATSRFLFLSWQHELPLVLCLSPCNGWQHWMWNWSFEATGKSWFLIRSFRASKPTISPGNAQLSCHQNRWIFLPAFSLRHWRLGACPSWSRSGSCSLPSACFLRICRTLNKKCGHSFYPKTLP